MASSLEIGTGQAAATLVKQALRAFNDDRQLQKCTSFARWQLVDTTRRHSPAATLPEAMRAVLNDGLRRLQTRDTLGETVLRRHFVQKQPVSQVAFSLNFSQRSIFKLQQRALVTLAQLLWQAEEYAQRVAHLTPAQQQTLDELPPPTFSRLFGADHILAALRVFLAGADARWLVALDGMGGIGKTALAREICEELAYAGSFQRVVWITVQQRSFVWGRTFSLDTPALSYEQLLEELGRRLRLDSLVGLPIEQREAQVRNALRACPTLIVVDNLETAPDVQALVMGLHRLSHPTRILITSRYAVSAFDPLTSLSVGPLDLRNAVEFIRYEGQDRNIKALCHATDEDLLRIARITDGNPLAIKWVVGQLFSLPLDRVLTDLVQVAQSNHDLYRFLFNHAWRGLSAAARRLLVHMPLLDARGASWRDIAAVSGVTADSKFCRAIQELVNASLLNVGHSQKETIYSIHRLTEYFVLSELVGIETPGAVVVQPADANG